MENKPQERGSSRLSLDTRRNSFKPRLPASAVVFNVGEATLINGDAGQSRRKWEARSMESNSCCRCCEGGVEAGLQAHDAFILFLRQKEKRLRRMAQFIVLAALMLVSGALALVITVGLGGRCPPSPDSQVTFTRLNSACINLDSPLVGASIYSCGLFWSTAYFCIHLWGFIKLQKMSINPYLIFFCYNMCGHLRFLSKGGQSIFPQSRGVC